jgi:hypothetical protein
MPASSLCQRCWRCRCALPRPCAAWWR